jgi:flagellar hook-basal body complex protein FliE
VTVSPLPAPGAWSEPDAPLGSAPSASATAFAGALADAFAAAGTALQRADAAEHAFAHGRGGLQEMVLERAQADVALALASATASRAAQALTTVLGMQV